MSPNPIEPWKLTAFLLNELEAEDFSLVESAVAADPELQAEVASLRATLERTRSALSASINDVSLNPIQIAAVEQAIASNTSENSGYSRLRDRSEKATTGKGLLVLRGIVALAAGLLIVAIFTPTFFNPSKMAMTVVEPAKSELAKLSELAEDAKPELKSSAVGAIQGGLPAPGAEDPAPAPVVSKNEASKLDSLSREIQDTIAIEEIRTEQELVKRKEAVVPESGRENPQAATPTASPVRRQLGESKEEPDSFQAIPQLAQRLNPTGTNDIAVMPQELSTAIPVGDPLASVVSDAISAGEIDEVTAIRGGIGGGGLVIQNAQGALSYAPSLPLTSSTASNDPLGIEAGERVVDQKRLDSGEDLTFGKKRGFSSGDRFEKVMETPFLLAKDEPLSTFSIDVDTASYSKLRQYLMQANSLPQPSSVRIEEMINYFDYNYVGPEGEHPFASNLAVGTCPWNEEHQLVRIGLQAKKIAFQDRPKANLVFLLDVSGSMDEPNKLPLVKQSIAMLARQLGENDRIAMVVYAGAAGCVLPSITGDHQTEILKALDNLQAGGSTNGGQGIELAYQIAREHFVTGGINRVILCSDGDFNVGTTSNEGLVSLVEKNAKSKVFLTCLGFGIGNYNDAMMEQITNRGNGTYGMVDSIREARRLMIEQLSGTIMTVAKDVKIQVEFNPSKVTRYRLIGYENRRLANQDFNNDAKDAGEIGAGHRVTALYEIVPVGVKSDLAPPVDDLRYGVKASPERDSNDSQKRAEDTAGMPAAASFSDEWMTLKLRYKQPEGDVSTKMESFLKDQDIENKKNDNDFRWTSAVAEFGLLLRRSELAPQANWERMIRRAQEAAGDDAYRLECVEMMIRANDLAK